MRFSTMISITILLAGVIVLVAVRFSDKKKAGVQLHTYEITYIGVGPDWQDKLFTDTIRVPKVLDVLLADIVTPGAGTATANKWLLLNYEDCCHQPDHNYIGHPLAGYWGDYVALDNMVTSLISFREIQ